MHIDPLEKKWMYVVGFMTVVMVGSMTFAAITMNLHPPSNVETIDPKTLHLSGEFTEDNLGVTQNADGSYMVRMIAARYSFYPQMIEVPVDTDVTFRLTSPDIVHGVHVPFTNMSTMVIPGYVSEVKTRFVREGEAQFLCNEYCGLGHDYMWSKLKVVPKG
ncbi:MAG: cytochrome C oxidase subunit II [Gammaproteobacteria bacterium]|nr:cytochrome C oxidase subunit II [Gammaproteobacteria bacterium]